MPKGTLITCNTLLGCWHTLGCGWGSLARGVLRELFGSLCHKKGAGGVAGWAPLRPCVYDAICRGKGLRFESQGQHLGLCFCVILVGVDGRFAKPNLHLTSEPKSLFYLAYLFRILEVSLRASVCNRLVKALWGFVVFSQASATELGKKEVVFRRELVKQHFGIGSFVLLSI
ncbi:hypothetical protein EPI10_024081 [Gossypium australe]|uniref:Uncharacterized protein n=1 Tax=Gossypium australe TaxID=47621 RepID=A0A5B6VXR0_9ROSI|nr:hypothetical protein EPI10_024081 [Gossypium australe]